MTFDAIYDWLENQVTSGVELQMEAREDGRFQVQVTTREESGDRDVTTIAYYRGTTLLDAVRLAMEDNQ